MASVMGNVVVEPLLMKIFFAILVTVVVVAFIVAVAGIKIEIVDVFVGWVNMITKFMLIVAKGVAVVLAGIQVEVVSLVASKIHLVVL